ncbi:autotransporter outer membrane beta-barrel domain-containing protein [Rahnella sikkimica]|uniref:autotransporter outer membrane beta-barrel domain-containing protein n=1 Tax=Rahnella sikkimica TaxID=1805933 RepID=UPI000CF3B878|nr:autotransporter outer membrane beta-barrel domain-containing protein [Rahnella sikkimica]
MKLKGADRLSLGLMTGYGTSKSKTHSSLTGYSSKGTIHGYSAGLYGTWIGIEKEQAIESSNLLLLFTQH